MAREHDSDSLIARAGRAAGSQSAFGRLLGKRQSTIQGWLKAGRVSPEYVIPVERVTGISRHELRPDLYPVSDAPGGTPTPHGGPTQ